MIKSDSRPLYLQVIDKIKEDIESGVFETGRRLPSEFQLSRQLGVSRATLREALRMLEDENVVVRRHGVGTFVNNKPLFSSGIEELFSVTDMIRRGKKEPGTNYLSTFMEPADEDDKHRFRDQHIDNIITVERVRTADDEPVVYCLDRAPDKFLNETFHGEQSIFDQMEKSGITITYAMTHIEPIGYDDRISEILECEPETSLLVLKQMHYDDQDRAVLYSKNYFRADKFKFHVVRKRVF
ncbi:GntR family transcriptional regulator [Alkalicoccus chagannorensis]|uniref:GntR family transcriptional regulator n=1 Tax=Alkalicoccus chagannorensis TaxID=427072 RepID=UPI00040801FA|nr:GntR family transcriptional regulator [Alkalicoccus chagannorensis]